MSGSLDSATGVAGVAGATPPMRHEGPTLSADSNGVHCEFGPELRARFQEGYQVSTQQGSDGHFGVSLSARDGTQIKLSIDIQKGGLDVVVPFGMAQPEAVVDVNVSASVRAECTKYIGMIAGLFGVVADEIVETFSDTRTYYEENNRYDDFLNHLKDYYAICKKVNKFKTDSLALYKKTCAMILEAQDTLHNPSLQEKSFQVSFGKIYMIPPMIETLSYIQELDMFDSGIGFVQKEISGLTNLQFLNLASNPLNSIEGVQEMKSLKKIDLRFCKATLDYSLFSPELKDFICEEDDAGEFKRVFEVSRDQIKNWPAYLTRV
jgi:hypothetical protein